MAFQHEKRKFPRMSISGRNYGVRFVARGQEIHDCRLTDLSAGGCGVEVQMADACHLEVGEGLEQLYLDHPDLPWLPLSASVVRMLGKVPGLTPFVQGLIADHVAAHLAGEDA